MYVENERDLVSCTRRVALLREPSATTLATDVPTLSPPSRNMFTRSMPHTLCVMCVVCLCAVDCCCCVCYMLGAVVDLFGPCFIHASQCMAAHLDVMCFCFPTCKETYRHPITT